MPSLAAACPGPAPLKRKLSSLSPLPPLPALLAPITAAPLPADPHAATATAASAATRLSPHKRRRNVHDMALRSRAAWFANLTCYLWYAPPTTLRSNAASPEPVARPSSLGTMHPPPSDPSHTGIASPPLYADTLSLRLYPAPDFITFVHKILRTTQLSTSIVLVALYYLHRFKASQPHLACAPGSEYRAAIVSLMLANKYLDDNTYTSKTWSEVSNVPLASLTRAEMELWRGLGLTVHVPADQFDLWSHQLQIITAERKDACLRQQQYPAANSLSGNSKALRRLSPNPPNSSGYHLRSHTLHARRERPSPLRSRSVGRHSSSLSPQRIWETSTAAQSVSSIPYNNNNNNNSGSNCSNSSLPVAAAPSVASPQASRNFSAGSPASVWDATSTISTTPTTTALSDGPPSSMLSPAHSSFVPSFPCQASASGLATSPTYPPIVPAPAPAQATVTAAPPPMPATVPAPAFAPALDWADTKTEISSDRRTRAPAPSMATESLAISNCASDQGARANPCFPAIGSMPGFGLMPEAGPALTDKSGSYFTLGTPLRSPRTLVAPTHGLHAREPETLAYYQLASGSLFGIRSYFVPSPYSTPTCTTCVAVPQPQPHPQPRSQPESQSSAPTPSTTSTYYPLLPYTPPTQWGGHTHAHALVDHYPHYQPGTYDMAPAPVPAPTPMRVAIHPSVPHHERFNNGPQPDAWPAFAASLQVSPGHPF